MIINNDIYNEIYNTLHVFIKNNTNFPVDIKQSSLDKISKNLVVFTEENNIENSSTTRKEETTSKLSFELNIYSPIDRVINKELISKVEQARQLRLLVDYVMNSHYKLNRIFCQPTPNIDNNVYRITMRYTGLLNDNTAKLII